MRRTEVHAHAHAHRMKHRAVIIVSVVLLIAALIVMGGVLIWRYPGAESARAPGEEVDDAHISSLRPGAAVQQVYTAAQKTPLPPPVPPVAYNPPKRCPVGAVAAPGIKKSGRCGSASLSVLGNGACPTTVGSVTPVCVNEYNWSITVHQTSPTDLSNIPMCDAGTRTSAGGPQLTFDINHTRQLKNSLLYGSGSLVVINTGTCTTRLTSLLLVLEQLNGLTGTIPSRIAVIGVESDAVNNGCAASNQSSNTAYVCETASGIACNTPVPYSPRGLRTLPLDRTLIASGGVGCSQAVTFPVDFAFVLSDANKTFMAAHPTGYRIVVLATFDGCCDTNSATCGIDVDCNGVKDNVVTTRFASPSFSIAMNACETRCGCAPIHNTITSEVPRTDIGICEISDLTSFSNGTVCESGVFNAALPMSNAGFCCSVATGECETCNQLHDDVTDTIAPSAAERMACTGYDGSELLAYTDNRVMSRLTCERVPRVCPGTIAVGSACQPTNGCFRGSMDCSSVCESAGNVCIDGTCTAVPASDTTTIGIAAAPPKTPPVGAASLSLDQCGCESGGDGVPTCAQERAWNISKVYNANSTSFTVTTVAHDRFVVRGIFRLEVVNSGVSTTALTSVYVGLERGASRTDVGTAPGPSGKNFLSVATATVSAASTCGQTANICSTDNTNFVARMTTGSSLSVTDVHGNSLVVAGDNLNVPIPGPRDNDGDGRVNEDSPDVTVAETPCAGTNLTADEDGDGSFNEDGVCQDRVTFMLAYAFEINETQRAAMAGAQVRVNVLATFLANAARGAVCTTDTNCDGTVSDAERIARTVQVRQGFTFPSSCPLLCRCAQVTDKLTSSTVGLTTGLPAAIASRPQLMFHEPSPFPYCSAGVRTFVADAGYVCSSSATEATRTLVSNKATLNDASFGSCTLPNGAGSLLSGSPATASYFFDCPQAVFPSPSSDVPSPSPSDNGPPPLQPPPVGALCTYTRGVFTGASTCRSPPAESAIACLQRHELSAACVREACTLAGFPAGEVHAITLVGQNNNSNNIYTVGFGSDAADAIDNVLEGIVDGNTGTPALLTISNTFNNTMLAAGAAAFQTSAGNFLAQLTVAMWNVRMSETWDNATSRNLLERLVFKDGGDCDLPVWLNSSVSFLRLLQFARVVIGIRVPVNSSVTLVDICRQATDYANPLCGILEGRVGPTFGNLASDLTAALDLFNREYDNCDRVATGCLVLAPPACNGSCTVVLPPTPAPVVTCDSYECIPGDERSDVQMPPALTCTSRPCESAYCKSCDNYGTCVPIPNCAAKRSVPQ